MELKLTTWSEYRDWRVPETVLIRVTPEVAAAMLQRNTDARPWRPWRTRWFEKQLKRDRFYDTGQGLIFFNNGVLGDGQHRCRAIINTGISVIMRVSFGVRPEARDSLDRPLTRSRGDILAQRGEAYYSDLAAALKLTKQYLGGYKAGSGGRYEIDEMIDDLGVFEDIRDYIPIGRLTYRELPGIIPRVAVVGAYLTNEEPDALKSEWFNGLIHGTGRYEGDPRTALERQLARRRRSDVDPIWMIAIYGRAYNAWRQRRTVQSLTWRRKDAVPVFGIVPDLRELLADQGGDEPEREV